MLAISLQASLRIVSWCFFCCHCSNFHLCCSSSWAQLRRQHGLPLNISSRLPSIYRKFVWLSQVVTSFFVLQCGGGPRSNFVIYMKKIHYQGMLEHLKKTSISFYFFSICFSSLFFIFLFMNMCVFLGKLYLDYYFFLISFLCLCVAMVYVRLNSCHSDDQLQS